MQSPYNPTYPMPISWVGLPAGKDGGRLSVESSLADNQFVLRISCRAFSSIFGACALQAAEGSKLIQ
jgi:hypothetical protein